MLGLAAVPKWAWVAAGTVLLAVAFYLTLNAYGNSRYKSGKADADAAWQAASDKLIDQAAASGKKADTAAAAREADFAARVEDERERIEDATANGQSAFDVLFGAPAR